VSFKCHSRSDLMEMCR